MLRLGIMRLGKDAIQQMRCLKLDEHMRGYDGLQQYESEKSTVTLETNPNYRVAFEIIAE